MKITAAVVPARSAPFEIETLDLTAPLSDEVLVRVVASGMCHTDLHARDGYFPNLPYPVVCGHEGAGIVEQVGAAVADLAPGDPVVISFPWCGECGPCRAGRISYCERGRPLKSSGRHVDGSIPMSRNGEPVYSCFFQAPEAHIATKLGIAKNTLSKYFAAELEAGQQEAKLQVGTFILDSILGRGGIRDDRARATLAIFYAKTRMGWKETGIHLHGEAHPDTDTALEALTRRFDRLAARKGEETAAPACTGGSEGSSEVGLAVLGETGATIASG